MRIYAEPWRCAATALALAAYSPAQDNALAVYDRDARATDHAIAWRQSKHCGPNCMYLLARLSGFCPAYDALCIATNVGEMGCSIADLMDAAQAQGIPVVAYQCSYKDLPSLGQAVIMHLETDAALQSGSGGHFIVAQCLKDGRLAIFDGTTGLYEERGPSEILPLWTGYVLAIDSRRTWWQRVVPTAVAIAVAAGTLAWMMQRLLTGKRRKQSLAAAGVVGCSRASQSPEAASNLANHMGAQ
jgi:hypothetical protein